MALGLILALAVQVIPVGAQSYDPADELPRTTGFEKSLTKFGRGISNVLFGWGELPLAYHHRVMAGRPLANLVGVGTVMGISRALVRTSTGVFEMVTFPFSDRDVNYDAVLKPEYIF
jgi:putative exosortase-associated protein (TIGR04073 family)